MESKRQRRYPPTTGNNDADAWTPNNTRSLKHALEIHKKAGVRFSTKSAPSEGGRLGSVILPKKYMNLRGKYIFLRKKYINRRENWVILSSIYVFLRGIYINQGKK